MIMIPKLAATVILFVIVLIGCHPGHGLKCYECDDGRNITTKDRFNCKIRQCPDTALFCHWQQHGTTTSSIMCSRSDRSKPSGLDETGCKLAKSGISYCYCDTDLCNRKGGKKSVAPPVSNRAPAATAQFSYMATAAAIMMAIMTSINI